MHPHARVGARRAARRVRGAERARDRRARAARSAQNVVLAPRVVIGARVRIGAGAVIGRAGFGWADGPDGATRAIPQLGGVVIEDDVRIGAALHDRRGHARRRRAFGAARSSTRTSTSATTARSARAPSSPRSRASRARSSSGAASSSAVRSAIADHVRVGDGARIAAKSGVIGDVPAGAVVAGYPAVDRATALARARVPRARARSPQSDDMSREPHIDIDRILQILPHRWPFVMVDRVTEVVAARAHPRAQVRQHERAVVPRALPGAAHHARRAHPRGARADRRHPRVRERAVRRARVAHVLPRHRQGEVPPPGHPGRSARSRGHGPAPPHERVEAPRRGERRRDALRAGRAPRERRRSGRTEHAMADAHSRDRDRRPRRRARARTSRSARTPSSARACASARGRASLATSSSRAHASARQRRPPVRGHRRRAADASAATRRARRALVDRRRQRLPRARHGPPRHAATRVTRIGSNNLFMVGCHVAHDVTSARAASSRTPCSSRATSIVEDYVTFGGLAGVAQFVRVGESAFVAAGRDVRARRAAVRDRPGRSRARARAQHRGPRAPRRPRASRSRRSSACSARSSERRRAPTRSRRSRPKTSSRNVSSNHYDDSTLRAA